MAHFAGPQLVSIGKSSGFVVPAGLIVGFEGDVADIPGDWWLCDGDNGTPDLVDHFIIGANGSYPFGTSGGASTGNLSGTTAISGLHTGSPLTIAGNPSGSPSNQNADAGAHDHDFDGDCDWKPPCRSLVFIQAKTAESVVPPQAVLWLNDTAAPDGFTDLSDAEGRFLLGVDDDTRTQQGSDTRNYSITAANDGAHIHLTFVGTHDGTGGGYNPLTAGGHGHTDSGSASVDKPPFHALLTVMVVDGQAEPLLVAAYNGDLGDLTGTDWVHCDGTNGTPDMGGKMPLGADGATYEVGDTGGSATPTITDSMGSTVNHHHEGSGPAGFGARHGSYDWIHSHAYTADLELPPWQALHFVMLAA